MTIETLSASTDIELVERISRRAYAQMIAMIRLANNRDSKRDGDPKVGGHPASCASSLHILGALHLVVRQVEDFVCCKPHASPMDHALHHLLGLFRDHETGGWLSEEDSAAAMTRLRAFSEHGEPVFQSYHARSDPDSYHFLPSGSVGIPPVVSVYMALAHRYARDHGMRLPLMKRAHFWSLIGDSEFREGSLLECMPDVAERLLGNVTWIIDYNRQNLDGTRIPNERGLHSRDSDRIERTARANGWRVIQVRHGSFRGELFDRPGGEGLRHVFEGGLSDVEFQELLFNANPEEMRERCIRNVPSSKQIIESLTDEELLRSFGDLGGHDMARMVDALQQTRAEPDDPYLVIAHTIKGWGMECSADPSNHSALTDRDETVRILEDAGLTEENPFEPFPEGSEERAYLDRRRDVFRSGIEERDRIREANRQEAKSKVLAVGGLPESLDIDTSLYPRVHTQWMWGQLASKIVRIGTAGGAGPQMPGSDKELTENEQRWKTAADFVLTLSPDVGTSTNIAPTMDQRIYGPEFSADDIEIQARHPELATSSDAWTRHIRFEIAEANCMSAAGAFGKMGHYTGLPMFPIMTVYDFFIKRALDQLYYNLYWGSEFVIIGTPSGVTLSSEGAQHSWKSDIQIPNLITWEPFFAVEMDWILSDAIKRHMEDTNEGRRGVLIRGVTRAHSQRQLLTLVRRQAASKRELPSGAVLKPAGAADDWGDAIDESSLPALDDDALMERLRQDVLAGGYYLVDWRGYAGYEPGDNVVNVFSMGSVTTEAEKASEALLERGIFANVICVTSPELMFGILGEADDYAHLLERLGVDGNLHVVEGDASGVGVAGRRVPCVAVCDGEAGLLDNIGSIVGVKQRTLAVRKFSKCGRPDQVYEYQDLDSASIVDACGRVLSETALEDLRVSPAFLDRIAGRTPTAGRPDWRELWPEPGSDADADRPTG